MKAYEILKDKKIAISLDFYGDIADDIRDEFIEFITLGDTLHYHGVFDAVNCNVYRELNQYDIMLLPTGWEGEGVSGALVESKMAGITAIVSDRRFNPETVRDGEEGLVIKAPLAENLAIAINELADDWALLEKLKQGAYESRKRYCIQNYRDQLISKALGQ